MRIYTETHRPEIRQGAVHQWREADGQYHVFWRFRGRIAKGQGDTLEAARNAAKQEAERDYRERLH